MHVPNDYFEWSLQSTDFEWSLYVAKSTYISSNMDGLIFLSRLFWCWGRWYIMQKSVFVKRIVQKVFLNRFHLWFHIWENFIYNYKSFRLNLSSSLFWAMVLSKRIRLSPFGKRTCWVVFLFICFGTYSGIKPTKHTVINIRVRIKLRFIRKFKL